MSTLSPRRITGAMAAVALSLSALPAAAQQAAAPPPVTVGGVVYSQFQYDLKDSAGAGNQNQFSVKRAYINAIGRFGPTLLTRVTVDINPTGGPATTAAVGAAPATSTAVTFGGNQLVRLKYAYVAWTPEGSALTYKMGMLHTPWVDWEEAMWDYRMQGTGAIERFGYLTSSDVGVGADLKVNNDQVNGQFTVVNGEGYSGGTGDNGKDVQARLSFRVAETDDASRTGGLRVSGYAGYGSPTGGGVRARFLGQLSYRSKMLTLAGQFAATTDSIGVAASKSGTLISGFGVLHIPSSDVALIARVDLNDPNTLATATNDKLTRIIAGISYQVTPQFRLLANIDNLTYENPTPSAAQIAVQSQALFQAQITF